MTKKSDIVRTALEDYLDTEDKWCTGKFAQNGLGQTVPTGTPGASHCAEGAVMAAMKELDQVSGYKSIFKGLQKILLAEHPEFSDVCRSSGDDLTRFNDGVSGIHSVGYQGIRSAFEKYIAQCEELGE